MSFDEEVDAAVEMLRNAENPGEASEPDELAALQALAPICPWNKFASESAEAKLALREDLVSAPLAELAALDEAAFRARFAGTPVKRTGRARFLRNVAIAIGASAAPSLAPAALRLLADPSPLVRGAAVWALGRLLDPDAFAGLKASHGEMEPDAAVRAEWKAWPSATTPPARIPAGPSGG